MGSLKAFWESATTRAIAIVSVVGLFLVYLIHSWRRAGADVGIQNQRMSLMRDYDEKRVELKNVTVEEVNLFETTFQSKMTEIDEKQQRIKADVEHSRKRLADALNKSFGR
tara:strand:- start:1428 stop:1760 length:333 start_codon:yes stop_codon:yes gene_type:complete